MSKITDEMLNDFIDNQLDLNSLSKFNENIKFDEDALRKLKALKVIDNILSSLEAYPAPDGFTKKVMNKILSSTKSTVPKVNKFFVSMISVLSISICSVLVVAIISTENSVDTLDKKPILDTILNYIKTKVPLVLDLFNDKNVLTIGFVLTVILLISSVFVFESYKTFKQKLNNY